MTATCLRPLPEAPRRLRIGMPHLDAGGLSENWLLRHAGDLHWQAVSERLAAVSNEIQSAEGHRLYPTFVAVRARYHAPLATVRENDLFEAAAEVVPCGGAFAQGRITAWAGPAKMELELLSTFALHEGAGVLKMALPGARQASHWAAAHHGPRATPSIVRIAKAARRGQPVPDAFSGPALALTGAPLGHIVYEPSPYADYNGAGLLYFASYVTIADTAERRLVKALGLGPRDDWALAASPLRRDVFYYGNLPLGEALVAELMAFQREPGGALTRVRLRRAEGGAPMADVVTRKEVTSWRR